jgi:predicted nucleic acid-binding protein
VSSIGRVLDTSALIDAATGRTQYFRAVITVTVELGGTLAIPTSAWLEAWALAGAEERLFLEFLRNAPKVRFVDLGVVEAEVCGDLGSTAIRKGLGWDVRSAQVTATSLSLGYPVVTGDPGPLLFLAPQVQIDQLP